MSLRIWVVLAALSSLALLGNAVAGPGEYASGGREGDRIKTSFDVRFVGGLGYEISNANGTARIFFDELRNQSAAKTSGPLQVRLFVTTAAIAFGDRFTSHTVAKWDAPQVLLPGYRYQDVEVTRELLPVPNGVYYVHLGVFESDPSCGATSWCYTDIRTFATRVQVKDGIYSNYVESIQPGSQSQAVEYFHAGLGHYFLTAQADEIAAIDSGIFAGWSRTGATFNVWTSGAGLADVCRFFTAYFAPKGSHFYTAIASECEGVKENPIWQYEKLAFKVALPLADGSCPTGVPLYRLFNNGQTGAPNHRYTTSLAVRQQMIGKGFAPEDANTMCVASAGTAPTPSVATAEGLWEGFTSTGRAFAGIVLSDGSYYFLYSTQASDSVLAGVVLGTGASSSGAFTSNNARDFNFEGYGVASGSVSAQFVPKSSMAGTVASPLGSATFTATYNPDYDHPASLVQLAGSYSGQVMVSAGLQSASVSINAAGQISGGGQGCNFTGTATPRGSINVFNLSITFGGGFCVFGSSTLYGIAYYDTSSGLLYAIAPNAARTDGILFVGQK